MFFQSHVLSIDFSSAKAQVLFSIFISPLRKWYFSQKEMIVESQYQCSLRQCIGQQLFHLNYIKQWGSLILKKISEKSLIYLIAMKPFLAYWLIKNTAIIWTVIIWTSAYLYFWILHPWWRRELNIRESLLQERLGDQLTFAFYSQSSVAVM